MFVPVKPKCWITFFCALFSCAAFAVAAKKENGLAPAPAFSVEGGVFTNAFTVTLSADGAVVRYTLDGSVPDESSRIAREPIGITNSALIRARAFLPGKAPSLTVSHSYTLLDEELANFTSNLPLVILNAHGEEVTHDGRVDVSVRVIDRSGERASLLGTANFDGRSIMNIRGHSSQRYPKNSYTLRTVDERNDKKKASILGLPKENEWILYAPYPDKTLMRDVLAYELSNEIGHWAPRTRYVEVFYNRSGGRLSMSNYVGVYVFEDRVSRSKSRVDIEALGPGDNSEPAISGGYLIKKDHVGRGQRAATRADRTRAGGEVAATTKSSGALTLGGFPGDPAGFAVSTNQPLREAARRMFQRNKGPEAQAVTNYVGFVTRSQNADTRLWRDADPSDEEDGFWTALDGVHFFYVEPEPDELTALQRAWLADYFRKFETALYGSDFKDPLKGYAAFIDVDSFIDHHWLVEVAKNVDGFRFSTYYHKDRGGKLKMGPLWDMNLTFGNARSYGCYNPEGWLWPNLDDGGYSYFRRLFEDPDFAQRFVDRWAELRRSTFATSNVLARMTRITEEIDEAQKRNFQRWPILGEEIRPNYFVGTNYADEVRWMREWVSNRLEWIERQFVAAPALKIDGSQLQVQTNGVTVYFTTDGTDPRASGGGVAPTAKVYTGATALTANAKVVARANAGPRWSAQARLDQKSN